MDDLERIGYHLDSVAGVQMALSLILSALIDQLPNKHLLAEPLRQHAERVHADMLASSSSDRLEAEVFKKGRK